VCTSRKTFHSSSLSYCSLLNEITSTKKLHFLESVRFLHLKSLDEAVKLILPFFLQLVGFMNSTNNLYTKSIKSIEDVSPLIRDLTVNIQQVSTPPSLSWFLSLVSPLLDRLLTEQGLFATRKEE